MIDNISASFLLNCSGLNIFPGALKSQNSCGLHHAPHFQLSNGSSKSKICSSSAELLQFLTQPTYDPADNHHSSTNPPGHRECATATPARGHTQGNETLPNCFGHDIILGFLKRKKPPHHSLNGAEWRTVGNARAYTGIDIDSLDFARSVLGSSVT